MNSLIESAGGGDPIEPARKVLRRLYEPLLLLEALRRAPEKVKATVDVFESTSTSMPALRRSFVDGISYLCAAERISDCVTAAAVERTPQGPVLWLSTNSGVTDETVEFLQDFLQNLHAIASAGSAVNCYDRARELTPSLLRQAIAFGSPRLKKYVQNIYSVDLELCVKSLRQVELKDKTLINRIRDLCSWLENTFNESSIAETADGLFVLVLNCYIRRKTGLFEPLNLLARQIGPAAWRCGRLFLLLCKLGKHVTMTRKVVEATVHLCDDFRESIRVCTLRPAPEKPFPLTPKEGNLSAILGRAFSNTEEKDAFMVRLRSLWNPDEIQSILSKERPRKTKVHAEALLADHFYRHNLQFLDGQDKYIGCSKPACYLCCAYFHNHPAGFAVSSSHQKIYTAWRCPGPSENEACSYQVIQKQEELWLDLIKWIRKDLRKEVESRAPRAAIPPDSTAGLTSENANQFAPFDTANLTAMLPGQASPPLSRPAMGASSVRGGDVQRGNLDYRGNPDYKKKSRRQDFDQRVRDEGQEMGEEKNEKGKGAIEVTEGRGEVKGDDEDKDVEEDEDEDDGGVVLIV